MDGMAPIMGKDWCPATKSAATTAAVTVTIQQVGARN
jgi:hypothetical protein